MVSAPGVYCIRHVATNRVYVGSTNNLSKRLSRHRRDLTLNRHHNSYLQSEWNRYGADAFIFEVLELTPQFRFRERYWISQLSAGQNGFNRYPVNHAPNS
jgi:group I intron endonuclease